MQKLTLVITDSGLGGLSTTADLYHKLMKASPCQHVRMVFFNALADLSMGYNNMKTVDQKVRVFNNALHAMHQNYHPDFILIACNTLSVIHEHTTFSQKNICPVVGIVDTGLKFMLDFLHNTPDSQIIILGTETTTQSGVYPALLEKNGIVPQRITAEACSTIHVEIENNSYSQRVRELIDKHVKRAVAKITNPNHPIGVSLNCTHYGYALDLFEQAFKVHGVKLSALINPNNHMADFLFEGELVKNARIDIEVVSQAVIPESAIASTAQLIKVLAPALATALEKHRHEPNLFEWKSLV